MAIGLIRESDTFIAMTISL